MISIAGAKEADQIKTDAQGDGRVGKIKNRPDAKIQKVNHRSPPDAIDPIAERAAENERERRAVQPRGAPLF